MPSTQATPEVVLATIQQYGPCYCYEFRKKGSRYHAHKYALEHLVRAGKIKLVRKSLSRKYYALAD